MPGRKNKLTKELINYASKLVEAGATITAVAKALGVSRETIHRWLREGEKQQEGLMHDFYEAFNRAEAKAIARNVAIIQRSAQSGNWQAAAWWLERKYPEEWGKRDKLDMHAKGDIKIQIERVKPQKEKEDNNG